MSSSRNSSIRSRGREVAVAAAAALGIGQSGSDARVLVRAAADARPDQNLAPKHIAPDVLYFLILPRTRGHQH